MEQTSDDLFALHATRDGTSLSFSSATEIVDGATAVVLKHQVAALSATRALVVYELDGSKWQVTLLDTSGTAPAVLDTADHPSGRTPGSSWSDVVAFSSTIAVWGTDDTNNGGLVAIDVSGDSISFGTETTITINGGTDWDIKKLASTTGIYRNQGENGYFTLDGTDITVKDTNEFEVNQSLNEDAALARLSDTEWLVFYEETTTGAVNAQYCEWTGSTISCGSDFEVEADGIFTQDNEWAFELRDRHVMAVWSSGGVDRVSVYSVGLEGTITESANDVSFFTPATVDHVTGAVFPSGDFVMGVGQDEATSPVKQGIAKILKP